MLAFQIVLFCGAVGGDTEGMISYWKLDEASGTLYDPIGNNNGTQYGEVTYGVTGQVGGALSFDGANDYVNVDSIVNSISNSAGSVSIWFNVNAGANSDNSLKTLFSAGKTEAGKMIAMCIQQSPTNIIYISHYGLNYDKSTGIQATAGTWNHLVYVWTSSNESIYLNGNLSFSFSRIAFTYAGSGSIARIGHYSISGWTHKYYGFIDEVAIFNRALTQTQITNLYNQGVLHKPYCQP